MRPTRRGGNRGPVGLVRKLRHTFASMMFACGEDPVTVMKALGHTDPADLTRVIDLLRRSGRVTGTKTLVVLGTETGGEPSRS